MGHGVDLIRPTRYIQFPRVPNRGEFELPVCLSLPSGSTHSVTAWARPGFPGETCLISTRLVRLAGGRSANRVQKLAGYGSHKDVLSVEIRIQREHDVLVSSTLAELRKLPSGVDLILGDALLQSLADIAITEKGLHMIMKFPKVYLFNQTSLDKLSQSAVLILGADYGTALLTLRAIEVCVNEYRSLQGWLLRDYHDISGRDLHQKLIVMAAASSFIIIADSIPSGHLFELPIVHSLSTPLALLRQSGTASSWMVDPLLSSDRVRVFQYSAADHVSLCNATAVACRWATEFIKRKTEKLDSKYPWRRSEIALARELFPED